MLNCLVFPWLSTRLFWLLCPAFPYLYSPHHSRHPELVLLLQLQPVVAVAVAVLFVHCHGHPHPQQQADFFWL